MSFAVPHMRPCLAGELLSLNVSDTSQMVSLTPALLHPEVPGVRVEVNGQVRAHVGHSTGRGRGWLVAPSHCVRQTDTHTHQAERRQAAAGMGCLAGGR